MTSLRIEVAGQTDVGRKRAHNEDNFSIIAEFGLYIVADGMGGHASGKLNPVRLTPAAPPPKTPAAWPYRE